MDNLTRTKLRQLPQDLADIHDSLMQLEERARSGEETPGQLAVCVQEIRVKLRSTCEGYAKLRDDSIRIENLPISGRNLPLDSPIYSKGKTGRGPFAVAVRRVESVEQ
jgi:hypothetical protein